MSCGHVLRSRLQDCGRGPVECEGERWRPAFIDDSCAECHRPMNYRRNRARFEAAHAAVMTGFRQARESGDVESMHRLRRTMTHLTNLARQRNFAVSLTRGDTLGDVKWPMADGGDGSNESSDGASVGSGSGGSKG